MPKVKRNLQHTEKKYYFQNFFEDKPIPAEQLQFERKYVHWSHSLKINKWVFSLQNTEVLEVESLQ